MRRVFSLWQPWATLCVAPDPENNGIPPKRWETRQWRPREEQLPIDVVIHATKRWGWENVEAATHPAFHRALWRCGFLTGPASKRGVFRPLNLKPLPLGAIIGVATIVDVLRTDDPALVIGEEERTFGNYEHGRYAIELTNVIQLEEPIPFIGRQEVLYRLLDPAIEKRINEQLESDVKSDVKRGSK